MSCVIVMYNWETIIFLCDFIAKLLRDTAYRDSYYAKPDTPIKMKPCGLPVWWIRPCNVIRQQNKWYYYSGLNRDVRVGKIHDIVSRGCAIGVGHAALWCCLYNVTSHYKSIHGPKVSIITTATIAQQWLWVQEYGTGKPPSFRRKRTLEIRTYTGNVPREMLGRSQTRVRVVSITFNDKTQ